MSKKPPYWGMSRKERDGRLEEDYEQEAAEHKEKLNPFNSLNPRLKGVCKCGGNYILRQNQKNKEYFYGCSNFPKCKIIREILLENDYLLEKSFYVKYHGDKILDNDRQYQEYLSEKSQRQQESEVEKEMKRSNLSKRAYSERDIEDNSVDISLGTDGMPIP